jgi:hypothetical protein
MATRRRRTAPQPPTPAPEPTHEEMLEVAAEREEVAEFLDVMVEDAFSNLGEQDFFEPSPKVEVGIPPAPSVETPPAVQAPALIKPKEPRYLIRENRSALYRRG